MSPKIERKGDVVVFSWSDWEEDPFLVVIELLEKAQKQNISRTKLIHELRIARTQFLSERGTR